MATLTWVGGTGTWNTTNTAVWSPAQVPTAADDVVFSSASTYTVTMSGALLCRDITVSAGTVTFFSTGTLAVSGSMSLSSGTIWSATGAITFNATTAKTITTSSTTISGPITFNGVGGSWQLQDALTQPSTITTTLTNGTLNLNTSLLTTGNFSSNNANTRTLAFGTGSITLLGTGTTAWALNTTTNLTVTGTDPTVTLTYSGASILTFASGIATEANSYSVVVAPATSGTYQINLLGTANFCIRNITFGSTFSGTWSGANTSICFGSLTLNSSMTVNAFSNTLTFGSTSATARTITTAGKTIDGSITINGVGGTFQLADALTMGATRTLTLTNGTLNLNNQTLTTGLFSSSNSNARTIAFGTSGSIRLNSNGGTLWTTATSTNFAYTGTSNITIDNNTATATTLTPGTLTEAQALSFNIISGTYTLTLTNTPAFKNLNFVASGTTGFAGTLPSRTVDTIIYGNLTLSSGMTLAASSPGIIFRATSGTQILTSNGKTFDMPMAQNGAGGTLQLADAFAMGASRTFNFNNGTFDGNSQTMTGATALSASATGVTAFKGMNTSIVFNHTDSTLTLVGNNTTGKISTINGSINLNGYTWTATGFGTGVGTKSLTFNGGTLLLTGPYAPTFDNFNPTGFTTIAGTGTGYIRMNAAAAKTFFGNGSTFNCILSNDGAGALTIQNSNTFLGITNGVSPTAFIFTAGTTQTMGSWTVSGTAGNLVTITSTAAGSAANLVKTGGGTVSADYLSIKDSAATPSTLTWYAGANSTNVSGNSGWIFTAPPSVANGNFFLLFAR